MGKSAKRKGKMVSYLSLEQQVIRRSSYSACDCSRCGKSIMYGESSVEVLVGILDDYGFQLALDDDNELEFDPVYYHENCWLETYDDTSNSVKDVPTTTPANSILTCSVCGCGIPIDEQFCRLRRGMVARSVYCPNGEQADEFEANTGVSDILVLCLSCFHMAEINNESACEEDTGDEQEDDD
jgi:hypothetical protein